MCKTITQLIEELQDICGSIGDIPVYIVDKNYSKKLRDWDFLTLEVDSIGDADENDICIIYPTESKKWNKIEHDPETGCVEGLPDEAGEYIFSFRNGTVAVDELIYDYYGVFLDAGDIYSVTAWMPFPEPYKEQKDA